MTAVLRITDVPLFEGAECARLEPEVIDRLFFGGDSDKHSIAEAKTICFRCAPRAECRTFAFTHGEREGIWGGLTENERRNLDRSQRRAAAKAIIA